MSKSALQLERYFFIKVNIEAQQEGPENSGGVISTKLEVSKNNEDPSRYMVGLTVILTVNEGKTAPYVGEVTVVGMFHIASPPDKLDAQKHDELVAVNGASILYGVAREMITNITARGPWPAVTLPCMNFNKRGLQEKKESQKQGRQDILKEPTSQKCNPQ